MKKLMSGKETKRWSCAAALLLMVSLPAVGQISNKAISRHEQLKRQSLKEASLVESSYKDTHLNMDIYTFRKGEAAKAGGRAAHLLRPANAPNREVAPRKAAREKKFRLFRKKNKDN